MVNPAATSRSTSSSRPVRPPLFRGRGAPSSDAGVSFHYNFPSNYGDFHVGVYNGENYQKVEVNDQKGLEFRGSMASPTIRIDGLIVGGE